MSLRQSTRSKIVFTIGTSCRDLGVLRAMVAMVAMVFINDGVIDLEITGVDPASG